MANPTTNFGWVMPTSSSLVTNLPADFNTFGQGVDTSMAQLKGGTTGQILSKTSATDMAFTWITPNPGDITAVTAGTGISGGGTSGDVTITNSMATEITAAGDIIVGTGSGTFDNLPIGTTNQVLTADTTVSPYKVKWATPAASASGMTFITSSTFSNVASVSIDGCFTSTYDQYYITFTDTFAATSADDVYFQFRYSGSTTQAAGYYGSWWYFPTSGASLLSGQYRNTAQATLGTISGSSTAKSYGTMQIGGAGAASLYTMFNGTYGSLDQETMNWFGGGNGTDSRTYTGFLFKSSSSNVTGTIRVYGLAKS